MVDREGPADLEFILEMALNRKEMREERDEYHLWTDQEYINFACMQDPNRTLEVDTYSSRFEYGERLLRLLIDSYKLPKDATIKSALKKKLRLKQHNAMQDCAWTWLQKEVIPEVLRLIQEAIFGTPIVEGIGLDSTDPSVACRDVASMVSFHGVKTRRRNFMSPPVSHTRVTLPLNEFGKVECVGPEPLDNHVVQTAQFEKHVESLGIEKPPPPLPRARYQIARLK